MSSKSILASGHTERYGSKEPRSDLIRLTGQRFGSWTVGVRAPNQGIQTSWWCRCDCGTVASVQSQHLRRGDTKQCWKCWTHEVGERIGTRVLVARKSLRGGGRAWTWRCDCGARGGPVAPWVLARARCAKCLPSLERGRAIPLTLNGETRSIRDWERHLGLGRNVVHERLRSGWSLARVLSNPDRSALPEAKS